jgi:Holliday junction resolvase RusA-like endonuclease
MGNNTHWTIEDFKKAGLIKVGESYIPASSQVAKGKVKKLFLLVSIEKVVTNDSLINIKPLSVNQVWQGKRFKTPVYKAYHDTVTLLLPADYSVPNGLLKVYYEFGMSNQCSDWDNPVKPFQDILQAKYGFNDSRIMEANVKKVKVKKGHEYIKFRIESL